MARIVKGFGPQDGVDGFRGKERFRVEVRGPHNRGSEKWHLDLGLHSGLMLMWEGEKNRGRAAVELAALREALDFLEAQIFADVLSPAQAQRQAGRLL